MVVKAIGGFYAADLVMVSRRCIAIRTSGTPLSRVHGFRGVSTW